MIYGVKLRAAMNNICITTVFDRYSPNMNRSTRRTALQALIVAATVATFGFAFAQGISSADVEKEISAKIGKLRSLEDTERAKVTMELALQIRKLPAGAKKLGLASSLANLSTEGDFGRDTLQEVTSTLVDAVKEYKPAQNESEPPYAYMQLAQLFKYERMKVQLDDPLYKDALSKLTKVDEERAKVDFTLTDISGKSWKLSSLKGKVVLVNFWATWCPPCRKEMPDMEALYNRFKDKGFVILAISDEDISKVKPFVESNKYTYPMLLDPGRKVNTAYHIEGIPKSFLYNREGKMVAQTIDMRTQKQFLELLALAGLK